jgi:hypothetical protein
MPTRADLKDLAKLRLEEAEYLYRKQLHNGSVYLCGYVVEFALKARICKVLKLQEYPDKSEIGRFFRTHDFEVLKLLAGLQNEITISKNTPLFNNWSIATRWKPEQRYMPVGTFGAQQAAIIISSIKDSPNGVLTWLSKRW